MSYIKRMVMHGFKSFAKRTEVIFDKGINCVVGPNGSGKSLGYDEVVTLSDGREIKIGELVEEQISKSDRIKTLDDGIYVDGDGEYEIISLNKENMKIENKKISKFIKREGDEIYKIKTRNGKELKATGCHPVMSFVNGKVESQLINDLREGSLIASPREIKIEGKNVCSKEIARLLGYIIGDGYIARDRIEFVNADKEVLEDFREIIKTIGLKYSERIDKGINRIYIRDREFVEKIRKLFLENYSESITSSIKKIPDRIMQGNIEIISNLLSGLFDTDGSIRKDIEIIEYCTKNKGLARQIQNLLLRFGIISRVKKRVCCAANTERKIKRDYFYIYIYGHENISNFQKKIKLRCKHKLEALIEHCNIEKIQNSNVDLLPREVNIYVKKIANLLGIKLKPLRDEYPSLMAYVENRCLPTRKGILNIIPLFEQKCSLLIERYYSLNANVVCLVECMNQLNISGQEASRQIGLNEGVIRNHWASGNFNPRHENLQKFYQFIKESIELRIEKAKELISLIKYLSNSDIFWDEITSIEKLEKEEFVYDLTIEDNHNFIANNIFAHNSNVSDALCFALGRLSIKSMRAAKAKNLLFMGSKYIKPAREASVELVFDNSDKSFAIEKDEVILQRTVRHNGQSLYKINGETKTRLEVIETLAQAGIDPYGFNLILQGKIQEIVKMHPEERRKIIEEVAGIAIYESRKEKSLKELEKTEERLKEINSILRERTAYMRNLDKERTQALRFKELELTIKRAKATLLTKRKQEKEKELENLNKSEDEKSKLKEDIKEKANELQELIYKLGEDINQINKQIQQATGLEQESLHTQIANLRAEIEGLRVRKEGYENRRNEVERRVNEMQKSIPSLEIEIKQLKEDSPLMAQKAQELKIRKDELAILEEEKKKIINIKSELNSLRDKSKDREQRLGRVLAESESLIKQLEEYHRTLKYKNENECSTSLEELKKNLNLKKREFDLFGLRLLENEKKISVNETEIDRAEKIKNQVIKIDTCPLCQSKITHQHIKHVTDEQEKVLLNAKKIIEECKKDLNEITEKRKILSSEVREIEENMRLAEIEYVRHKTMKDKNEQLKRIVEEEKILRNDIKIIENRRRELEEKAQNSSSIEEKYESKILEIEEISSRTSEDTDTRLLYKQREIEQIQSAIKINLKNIEELKKDIGFISGQFENKQKTLSTKEEQEKELQKKFKKLFEEREETQKSIQENNMKLNELNSNIRAYEEQINYLKIGKAKVDAEKEAIMMELNDYLGIEIIQGSVNAVEERLQKAQEAISQIGSINLKALEVYEDVKKEYDLVQEKVNTIDKEKQDILAIIAEIDLKKKRSFMKTFKAMSDLFSQNFSQLYTKGIAFLELENKEDLFAGGVNIVVRLAKGKYFDVTSLSGGEQTLVALSLLFAIQEYKPYHFYVLDEIDAALDKRNSERLAGLLVKYMKSGQYILVSHNDAIIMNSNVLYGVSMHDGVSKVLSLNLEESLKAAKEIHAQEARQKLDDAQKVIENANVEVAKTEMNGNQNEIQVPVSETRDVKG